MVASLVHTQGVLFCTGGFPEHHILGIDPSGSGDVTKTHILWRDGGKTGEKNAVSYVPSPIAAGDFFFVVSDSGVAHCFEATTGKIMWAERLGEHHASLVSANGLVYFLNDEGVMNVVRASSEFTPIAKNELGERTFASPAISKGQLFLRSEQHLFCIGNR